MQKLKDSGTEGFWFQEKLKESRWFDAKTEGE